MHVKPLNLVFFQPKIISLVIHPFLLFFDYLSRLSFVGEAPALQYLVLVSNCVSVGKITDSEIYRITGTTVISLQGLNDTDAISGRQSLSLHCLITLAFISMAM